MHALSGHADTTLIMTNKKLTREEELLLQDFSRNVTTKSSALFYGNAFIVSAVPICKYKCELEIMSRRVPVTRSRSISVYTSYAVEFSGYFIIFFKVFVFSMILMTLPFKNNCYLWGPLRELR